MNVPRSASDVETVRAMLPARLTPIGLAQAAYPARVSHDVAERNQKVLAAHEALDALAAQLRERDELRRWKALLARNVAMTRSICDDPNMALDFIEGFATDRIAMIVPPDMVDPADMAWAIQRGRELAAEHGWASPDEIAAAAKESA